MDVGGMSGTHVRRSSIAAPDASGAPMEESPMIAVKRANHGLLLSRSIGRAGWHSRAALNGAASRRFPKVGHQ